MYPSIFKSFPVIRTASAKKFPFSRTAAHIFVSPGNAPAIMTQSVAWMERQFNACQTPRSMYLSIFNTFRVIRRLIQSISPNIAIFLPHFGFPWGRPWGNHAKCCMGWKENSMLTNCLAVCTHLSSTVSQLFELQVQKNHRFHVPQPTFLFPLETPLRLSRNRLHGWKDNSMLAQPFAACTYLSSIVSELYDA